MMMIVDVLISKMPRALVSIPEISDELGVPPWNLVNLVSEAEKAGLIATWDLDGQCYCCLSVLEQRRRKEAKVRLLFPETEAIDKQDLDQAKKALDAALEKTYVLLYCCESEAIDPKQWVWIDCEVSPQRKREPEVPADTYTRRSSAWSAVGSSYPGWRPACEPRVKGMDNNPVPKRKPCVVCHDRPLGKREYCLGCCNTPPYRQPGLSRP